MEKIFDFDKPEEEQEALILAERTADFYKTARELSNFIAKLPLDRSENDELINLIIKQVQAAESGAFKQGFCMGIDFSEWQEQNIPPLEVHSKNKKEVKS